MKQPTLVVDVVVLVILAPCKSPPPPKLTALVVAVAGDAEAATEASVAGKLWASELDCAAAGRDVSPEAVAPPQAQALTKRAPANAVRSETERGPAARVSLVLMGLREA